MPAKKSEEIFCVDVHRILHKLQANSVSWDNKSVGILKLADSLSLGLDSVALVDDSATECAEVAASVPEVAVVQLPRNPSCFKDFLEVISSFPPSPPTHLALFTLACTGRAQFYICKLSCAASA